MRNSDYILLNAFEHEYDEEEEEENDNSFSDTSDHDDVKKMNVFNIFKVKSARLVRFFFNKISHRTSRLTVLVVMGLCSVAILTLVLVIFLGPAGSPASPLPPDTDIDDNAIDTFCSSDHESYQIDAALFKSKHGNYSRHAVAVDNEVCSRMGLAMLSTKMGGGSAVDAAITAGLCNGVMNPQSAGLGGGAFMVIYSKKTKKTHYIDAREQAPRSAHKHMFANISSQTGGLASGIPGELMGFWRAHQLGGRLEWRALFQPVIEMCQKGLIVSQVLGKALQSQRKWIEGNKSLREMFTNPLTSDLYRENETMRRPLLAQTLTKIANDVNGIREFYSGSLASDIVEEMNEAGANVTLDDLTDYVANENLAAQDSLGPKFNINYVPPPSGGILVSLIMRIMNKFDLLSDNSAKIKNKNNTENGVFYQRLVESLKHAYAYRAQLGDEPQDAVIQSLIKELGTTGLVDSVVSKISDTRTYDANFYGAHGAREDHGTAHLSVISEGDAVSLTSSVNGYFGAHYAGSRTGLIYNNQMDDFSVPGVDNMFGFAPSPSNFVKPGKRPMSSMSPVIITDKDENGDGGVRLVLGASGGSKIISSVAQVAIKNLWLGESIQEAVDQRRVHHQLHPNVVQLEQDFPLSVRNSLRKIGHQLQCFATGGSIVQAVSTVQNFNELIAVSDVRKGGAPAGI